VPPLFGEVLVNHLTGNTTDQFAVRRILDDQSVVAIGAFALLRVPSLPGGELSRGVPRPSDASDWRVRARYVPKLHTGPPAVFLAIVFDTIFQ
jgi:hypothetical protein